jgi:hypothetical protein
MPLFIVSRLKQFAGQCAAPAAGYAYTGAG